MRKITLTIILITFFVSLFSQENIENIDASIKEEVRLHPDVHLKYAHTSFSIDKYQIIDPNILVYSNSTGSFYLINQENQLIIDQLDVFKTYPKIKPLNYHFRDKSGARIKLLSPFYNSGFVAYMVNLEYYTDSLLFAGIVKLKGNFYQFLVQVKDDKIISSLKEYNIEELFSKPKKSKIYFQDRHIKNNLLRSVIWEDYELFSFAFDPYVKELPKDSIYAYEILYRNPIYALKNEQINKIFSTPSSGKYYYYGNYVIANNKLVIFDNTRDSIWVKNEDFKDIYSLSFPNLRKEDTLSHLNRYKIIKDKFTGSLYLIQSYLHNKRTTYSVYSIDPNFTRYVLIKSFTSILSMSKFSVYNGKLHFTITPTASEPSKLFSYDIYNKGEIGDTVKLTSNWQKPISLFRGYLKRDGFRINYGLENIDKDIYNIPKASIKLKFKNSKISEHEKLQQDSIKGLINLLTKFYDTKETNKILANLICYDKFEYKILEKEIKEDNFKSYTDSIFYETNIKEVINYLKNPENKLLGEMKTYHYEIKTNNGWYLYFYKKDNLWYLASVLYKKEDN